MVAFQLCLYLSCYSKNHTVPYILAAAYIYSRRGMVGFLVINTSEENVFFCFVSLKGAIAY